MGRTGRTQFSSLATAFSVRNEGLGVEVQGKYCRPAFTRCRSGYEQRVYARFLSLVSINVSLWAHQEDTQRTFRTEKLDVRANVSSTYLDRLVHRSTAYLPSSKAIPEKHTQQQNPRRGASGLMERTMSPAASTEGVLTTEKWERK